MYLIKEEQGVRNMYAGDGLSPLSPLLPGVDLESFLGKINRGLTVSPHPFR